jgi:hypothetical protein
LVSSTRPGGVTGLSNRDKVTNSGKALAAERAHEYNRGLFGGFRCALCRAVHQVYRAGLTFGVSTTGCHLASNLFLILGVGGAPTNSGHAARERRSSSTVTSNGNKLRHANHQSTRAPRS